MKSAPLADTEVIVTIVVSAFVFIGLIVFIILFILYYQKRQHQYAATMKAARVQYEQALLMSELEIREQTLQYVGYELHDNLGQIASLIKINLHTLDFEDIDKSRVQVEDTKELVRLLITDLKSLSLSMNSDRIAHTDFSLLIENEIQRLNKTGQFNATFRHEGNPITLDGNTTIIVYRMFQEIFNNAIKHSGSQLIEVKLNITQNLFTLVCRDEGVGFNLDQALHQNGSGLRNLQNRAKLINATLSFRSSAPGTSVTIELPI